MMKEAILMEIKKNVFNVGVNDYKVDLFESQYKVPNGMAYNSYLICDEKTIVIDSVEADFGQEWIDNIRKVLGERKPDYLLVQHMEPDHSGSISIFAEVFPEATIVSSQMAFKMMEQFYHDQFLNRRFVVSEGSELSLGEHTLHFITAPMVHWPEVLMSYESKDKILFSADAFGKFGALTTDEPWTDEARRYYIGIVGKYGMQVQSVLAKAAKLDIQTICSLHGPILTEGLSEKLALYQKWSSYQPEEEGVLIAYSSVYGHTREAATYLYDRLKNKKVTVVMMDLARSDCFEAVSNAFRFSKLVLATTTYNMDIFPCMRQFIEYLTARGYSNRKVALIENGTWAPMAAKIMKELLAPCKNITYANTSVKILSALSEENLQQLTVLADELSQ